jgi:hypothetical protein
LDLARTRKPFLPLLGERAGVRADFFILTSFLGFMERAGERCFVLTLGFFRLGTHTKFSAKDSAKICPANHAQPPFLAETTFYPYIVTVIGLTKQEWWVIGIVAGLLLTGFITKKYRASHPAPAIQQARP